MPNGSLRVRHISFAPQPLDLLSWFYVYLSDFGLNCNLIHHLALYQVSVRRLKSFATPLPSPLTLLLKACGSLRLAVTTCGWTFTSKICAMPDTQSNGRCVKNISRLLVSVLNFILLYFEYKPHAHHRVIFLFCYKQPYQRRVYPDNRYQSKIVPPDQMPD